MCEHQKICLTMLNLRYSKIKKIVAYDDKSFMKIIRILLLIVRFVKSSDQTIIQIRDVSKAIPTSKMKVFVILLVCSLLPSTNVIMNSILGVAGA